MNIEDILIFVLKELLEEKPQALSLLGGVVDACERVLPDTSSEGRYFVRSRIQDLQQALDALYEKVISELRELDARLLQWSGLRDSMESLGQWLKKVQEQLGDRLAFHATVEEKKVQLQDYRVSAFRKLGLKMFLDQLNSS